MNQNPQICCRLCLDVDLKHISLLEEPTVLMHIKYCLAINIVFSDELPKDVCVNCVSLLSEFYNFQQNARCSQDWLESAIQEKVKKPTETKTYVQPLPDSEYNSDSLLEFLNNTANIEEYLTNLGKEDIPAIVNMLDKTSEHNVDINKSNKSNKQTSPKKKEPPKTKNCIKMDIDVLDSDVDIVKEILSKETEPKSKLSFIKNIDKTICFACKANFDTIQKLSQHLSICDNALRTCIHCNMLFDSKKQMKQHSITHSLSQMICYCGKQFTSTETLLQHYSNCQIDQIATLGFHHRCKQCGTIFKDRFQLYKHAKEHIIKSAERVCDICGHTFMGNDVLAKHRKEEHEKPENLLYRCKVCNETSSSHKEMYVHVLKHTSKQVLPRHLCESCGHSFATKATLQRHSMQHLQSSTQNSYSNKKSIDTILKKGQRFDLNERVMCDKCGQTVDKCKLDIHLCV